MHGSMHIARVVEPLSSLIPKDVKRSVDGWKSFPFDRECTGVGVTWMATYKMLEEAYRRRLNLVITHEPTFFDRWDDLETAAHTRAVRNKMDLLRRTNIAIYRCSDAWDTFPNLGIYDSWAEQLGIGEPIETEPGNRPRLRVYGVEGNLRDLSKMVKERMGSLIRYVGKWDHEVTRLGIMPGSAGGMETLMRYIDMGIDAFITGEAVEWQTLRFAEEEGVGVIICGHMESEASGLQNLVHYIKGQFRELRVEYLDTGTMFNTP